MKVTYVKTLWDYAFLSSLLQMTNALDLSDYRCEYFNDFYGDFSHMKIHPWE